MARLMPRLYPVAPGLQHRPGQVMLLRLSSVEWGSVLEEPVEAAGEVALEAAVGLAACWGYAAHHHACQRSYLPLLLPAPQPAAARVFGNDARAHVRLPECWQSRWQATLLVDPMTTSSSCSGLRRWASIGLHRSTSITTTTRRGTCCEGDSGSVSERTSSKSGRDRRCSRVAGRPTHIGTPVT